MITRFQAFGEVQLRNIAALNQVLHQYEQIRGLMPWVVHVLLDYHYTKETRSLYW